MRNEDGIALAQTGLSLLFGRAKESRGKLLGFNNGVPSSMHKQIMNFPQKQPKLTSAAGFSMVELLSVIAVVAIISTFAFASFQKSRRTFNVAGSMRSLSAYLEKARLDSMRRHEQPSGANITINSASSYTVNMDFNGTGTLTARTITLPAGTTVSYKLPPATTDINPSTIPITITYDWRGRTSTAVLVTLTDSTAGVTSSTVLVGPYGDLSTDTTVTGPVTNPTPQTTVTTTSGIKSMYY